MEEFVNYYRFYRDAIVLSFHDDIKFYFDQSGCCWW